MKTKMYVIDDGVQHTICAPDEGVAYGEWMLMLHSSAGDWPDEKPTIREIESTKEVTIDLQCNLYSKRGIDTKARADIADALLQNPTLSAAEWCELVGTRYLACSEY